MNTYSDNRVKVITHIYNHIMEGEYRVGGHFTNRLEGPAIYTFVCPFSVWVMPQNPSIMAVNVPGIIEEYVYFELADHDCEELRYCREIILADAYRDTIKEMAELINDKQ